MRSSYLRVAGFEDRKIDLNRQFLRWWTDPQGSSGQSDFDEERDVGACYEDHRRSEEQRDGARKPGSEERVGEQRDDNERDQYGRAAAHGDSGVDVASPSDEHRQICMYLPDVCRMTRQLLFQVARPVHCARQATREDI